MGRKPPTRFADEVEAELGVITRACHDIDAALGNPGAAASLLGYQLDSEIRRRVASVNQRRRAALASQWRHELCYLAAELSKFPENEGVKLVRQRVLAFKPTDQRGKNKDVSHRAKWVEVDGELWIIDVNGRPLRPLNQPLLLLKHYDAIYAILKGHHNLRLAAVRRQVFPDVEECTYRRWMAGRTPTPSGLALLIAAYRTRLVSSELNLSGLREVLAGARMMCRISRARSDEACGHNQLVSRATFAG